MFRETTVTSCIKNNMLETLIGAKLGTLYPNRIFVGGLPQTATDEEVREFFSGFGQVKDVKLIMDRATGQSVRGTYGFVTFESPVIAQTIIEHESDTLIFQNRKLNISCAVKKQFPGVVSSAASPSVGQSCLSGTRTIPQQPPNWHQSAPATYFPAPPAAAPQMDLSSLLLAQQILATASPIDPQMGMLYSGPAVPYAQQNNALLNAMHLAQQTLAAQQPSHSVLCHPPVQPSSPISTCGDVPQPTTTPPLNYNLLALMMAASLQPPQQQQQPQTALPPLPNSPGIVSSITTTSPINFYVSRQDPNCCINSPTSSTGSTPWLGPEGNKPIKKRRKFA